MSTRFVMFGLVGGSGVIVHLGVLRIGLTALRLECMWAQAIATLVAMTCNFILNNLTTFRQVRLKGIRSILRGLLFFYLVCLIGTVANVFISSAVFAVYSVWWAAGIVGILVASIWNFVLSAKFVWRGMATGNPGASP